MEESGCASPETGWQPVYIVAYESEKLVGAMPLYFKSNSFGEFVFDWAWADAYEQNGLQYYPKLISSVPFTPVSGARILSPLAHVRGVLAQTALRLAKESGASSFHCLFPTQEQVKELEKEGMMLRNTVQFHWKNEGYKDFSDFLLSMRHEKRKNIAKERKKLRDAGISFEQVRGERVKKEDWEFFYSCYLHTHHLYQSPVSLSLEFFLQIGRTMPQNIVLIFASRNGIQIAAAFDLYNGQNFYGRSWGALEYVPGLHFEVCYYQAIEFCIANKIAVFEGGAQGEHKLARGLLPVTTWSGRGRFPPA
jgi:predicted N-acyltransferase